MTRSHLAHLRRVSDYISQRALRQSVILARILANLEVTRWRDSQVRSGKCCSSGLEAAAARPARKARDEEPGERAGPGPGLETRLCTAEEVRSRFCSSVCGAVRRPAGRF